VLISNFPLIKLASFPGAENKILKRNLMKTTNENLAASPQMNEIDSLNIFNVQTEEADRSARFNFENIILNLSIIENKIKSFKNKLESK